jgi:calcium-translocating P-type ATPase
VAGLGSLVAGLGVWAVTRSRRLAVATALAVDPHPALVGSEAAAEGASARLAREGIVCRGGHAWFLRTPDVLVFDGCRPLLDVDAREPSALGAAGRALLEVCADRSIRILVATDADDIDTAAGLLAGTGAEVVTDPVLEVVTDQQESGGIVAVVTDTVDTGEALGTADLAILLGATTPAELLSGVDLVVPDLTRMPQVLSVASRRERAERESVVISAAANVAGASWELLGRPGLRGVSFEVGLASLAALATSWLRLAGSSVQLEQAATTALRLSDPHPERWGREPVADVMAALGTSEHGLTGVEAARRWRPAPEVRDRNPFLAALLEQLRSPLTAALGAGAGLSLLMRSAADVGLIGAVVGANATIGAMEESRVGRAVDALRQMGTSTALVLRDGGKIRIPADEVVPGDVVLVSPGDRVPADARVFESRGLQVDEAALTGESLPVEKRADGPTDESRVLLEGSDVTVGHGRAVAFAVGADTRLGATAAALGLEPPPESPLNRRLGAMVRELMPVAIGGALLVAVIGVARRRPLLSQLALGASTAIAAVPEGLPLLARIGQTGVARRLAERNALVRRLAAVEALGRVDVACVDKTGTLTSGRLEVQLVTTFDDEAELGEALSDDLRDVLRVAAIACPRPDSSAAGAHPTDVAVLDAARAANLIGEVSDRREREAPFDPSTGIHASVLDGRTCLKGAPESIVPRCSRRRARGGEKALDDSERELLLARSNELAARGLRVLLVAEGPDGTHLADPRDLVALGFVCIADGPRPTAAEAVERCRTAGVRILMLTGDHPLTARAIARQVGIDDDGLVVLGDEIAALSDEELDQRMAGASVVARIAPLEKVRIVQSLQRLGHVVAMTGDGVNDAPALRLADVGVAMGRGGTEVARQAADVVLADDDIATLAEALVEGRTFWGNVRRSLGYLLGGNLGEIGFLVGASLFSPTTPLSARQVLAVNLGSDVLPALSLVAEEPPTHDLSSLAREGTAALERPLRIEILRRGITTAVPTLAAYAAALRSSPAQASTVAYASLVGCQLGHALDTARASGAGAADASRTITSTLGLLAATLVVPPLRSMLGLAPLTATGWALILLASCGAILLDRALHDGLGLGEGTTTARTRADEPRLGALA